LAQVGNWFDVGALKFCFKSGNNDKFVQGKLWYWNHMGQSKLIYYDKWRQGGCIYFYIF